MLIQLHITSVLNFDLMILTFNYLFKLVKKTSKYFRIKIWLFSVNTALRLEKINSVINMAKTI